MAGSRIRTLKPEFLEDERVAALSDRAFRLLIGSILLADDYGNFRGAITYLRGQVFWGREEVSPKEVTDTLAELVAAHFLQPYEQDGQKYLHIRTWAKHQKVDHPSKPRVPAYLEGLAKSSESLARISDGLAKSSETLAPDLDQYQDLEGTSTRTEDPAPRGRPGKAGRQESLLGEQNASDASYVLGCLNAARMRVMSGARALKATPSNLKHIGDRLREGHTREDCEHVIAVCEADVRRDAKSAEWFDAVTPFRPDNFARKLGRVPGGVTLPPAKTRPSNTADVLASLRPLDKEPPHA